MNAGKRLPGLVAAGLGLACGIAGGVTGEPALAIAAGLAALAAGAYAALLSGDLDDTGEALDAFGATIEPDLHLRDDDPEPNDERRGHGVAGAALATELLPDDAAAHDRPRRRADDHSDAGPVDDHQRRRHSDAPLLTDDPTGVMTAAYFAPALEDRIASARRALRPVSVVIADVVSDEHLSDDLEPIMGQALRDVLREADTACRLGENRYALLLDDTPDTSAVWAVERLRKTLASNGLVGLRAGIASYPTHGLEVEDVTFQAQRALDLATQRGRDGIQVARVD